MDHISGTFIYKDGNITTDQLNKLWKKRKLRKKNSHKSEPV